jgi:hypothetical protein
MVSVNLWIAQASIQSTQTFGYDVNESVSSESHTSVSGTINVLPGWVGASYRQAIRREISVPAVMHNRCGVAVQAGTLVMTDWYWHGDVNQGPSCAEVKPSDDALPVGPINN